MATVKILYWKDIPYGVRAVDDGGARVTKQLPHAFEVAVDAAAMAAGATETKAYQAEFNWAEPQERPGSAEEAAQAVIAEIEVEYPPARLNKLVKQKETK
jgi:hypothetical protein